MCKSLLDIQARWAAILRLDGWCEHDVARSRRGGVQVGGVAESRAELYDGFATIGKALSAGRRLEILDLLAQAPRSVGQLSEETAQSLANTSQHLQILLAAGLVRARRDGQRTFYELSRAEVGALLTTLRDFAVDEIEEVRELALAHLGDRTDLEFVSSRELARRVRLGQTVLIDVRPQHDFDAGHIAGAICLPSNELAEFAAGLAADTDVVAYCRGEFCSLADTAVRELRKLGVRARRLEEGFPEWQRAGLPLDEAG